MWKIIPLTDLHSLHISSKYQAIIWIWNSIFRPLLRLCNYLYWGQSNYQTSQGRGGQKTISYQALNKKDAWKWVTEQEVTKLASLHLWIKGDKVHLMRELQSFSSKGNNKYSWKILNNIMQLAVKICWLHNRGQAVLQLALVCRRLILCHAWRGNDVMI